MIQPPTHQSPVLDHEPLGEGGVRVEVLERLGLLLRELLSLPKVLPQEDLHLARQHRGLVTRAGLLCLVLRRRVSLQDIRFTARRTPQQEER